MPPPAMVARVSEREPVNGHRLTFSEVQDFPHATVWRVTSSERVYGHWRYTFDDLVLEMNLGLYLRVASTRGVQRISLHRMGEVQDVLAKGEWRPMKGAKAIASEKRLARIDEPATYRPRRKKARRSVHAE